MPGQTAQQYPACARNSVDQYKELVAVLAPGQSLRDPNTGVQIRVLSARGPFAKVRLGGARRTDFTAPQLQLAQPHAATTVSGELTVSAGASDEGSGIAKVVFYENSPSEPLASTSFTRAPVPTWRRSPITSPHDARIAIASP